MRPTVSDFIRCDLVSDFLELALREFYSYGVGYLKNTRTGDIFMGLDWRGCFVGDVFLVFLALFGLDGLLVNFGLLAFGLTTDCINNVKFNVGDHSWQWLLSGFLFMSLYMLDVVDEMFDLLQYWQCFC